MRRIRTLFILFGSLWGLTTNALEVIAFKGLHQSLNRERPIEPTTCTAAFLNQENHEFIENTLPSIEAAFALGADWGHFNIQLSADDQLVAFHDATLECRTDGMGTIRSHSLEQLKQLDPGYKYTWNQGQTFPLRGKWVKSIPTFSEILTAFPTKRFVINDKTRTSETIQALAHALSQFPKGTSERIYYTGSQDRLVRELIPGMNLVISKTQMQTCMKWWLLTSWTGYIHSSCKNTTLVVPMSQVRSKLSWAKNLAQFAHRANSTFWILEVDSAADAEFVLDLDADFIGTYRADHTLPVLKQR